MKSLTSSTTPRRGGVELFDIYRKCRNECRTLLVKLSPDRIASLLRKRRSPSSRKTSRGVIIVEHKRTLSYARVLSSAVQPRSRDTF